MKRSKLTNKNQMRMLVDEMIANVDIARGPSSTVSDEVTAFWCGLQLKLNKRGPPFRDIAGWKKVWTDYKCNVKKKITKNLTSDWEPYKSSLLSELEEEVNQLLGIEAAVIEEPNEAAVILTSDNVNADSSSGDTYTFNNFDKQKENSTELAAKAVRLYDLQIELLKKELNSWDKESSHSNTKSSPSSPSALINVGVGNFDISIDQNEKTNIVKEPLPKMRKFNINALSDENKITVEYPGRIKTEIINESEIDFEGFATTSSRPTKNGIFIIDTTDSPLPTLAPAPAATPPALINGTSSTPPSLPPALQPSPYLLKRKFDATTNTDLRETNLSSSQESILNNISNTLQEIRETNNNLAFYLQKLCATEEIKISLMQDANNEQKRHNQQMEKLARISL